MTVEQVKKEFEEFYKASPFVEMGEAFRVAMEGAYIAGWCLLAEEFKRIVDKQR